MFDKDWYIYSAGLGFILGIFIMGIIMVSIKTNIISYKIFDRNEKCKQLGGEYSFYGESSYSDSYSEYCNIKNDKLKLD